jgi:hypothetical protein
MADRNSTLHIRLPKKLRNQLQRAADEDGRTLSAYAVLVLAGRTPAPAQRSARVTRQGGE